MCGGVDLVAGLTLLPLLGKARNAHLPHALSGSASSVGLVRVWWLVRTAGDEFLVSPFSSEMRRKKAKAHTCAAFFVRSNMIMNMIVFLGL